MREREIQFKVRPFTPMHVWPLLSARDSDGRFLSSDFFICVAESVFFQNVAFRGAQQQQLMLLKVWRCFRQLKALSHFVDKEADR